MLNLLLLTELLVLFLGQLQDEQKRKNTLWQAQVSDVNVFLFGLSLLTLARYLNWKMFVLITLLQYSLNFADV